VGGRRRDQRPERSLPRVNGHKLCSWPEGDLYGLFAVSGHSSATLGILGETDDPEIYLVLDTPGTGSRTGTYGEPCLSGSGRSGARIFLTVAYIAETLLPGIPNFLAFQIFSSIGDFMRAGGVREPVRRIP
jgi:hypothetical protein